MSFTCETFCVSIQFRFEQSSRKKRKVGIRKPAQIVRLSCSPRCHHERQARGRMNRAR